MEKVIINTNIGKMFAYVRSGATINELNSVKGDCYTYIDGKKIIVESIEQSK